MKKTTKPTKNQNSSKRNSNHAESTNFELQILAAVRSLVPGLRDRAESKCCFSSKSLRRLLEEDMGLDKHALDVHKRLVKKHLIQCLEDTGNDGASRDTERKDHGGPTKTLSEEHEEAENISKTVDQDMKVEGNKETLMPDVWKALRKRASYIKANSLIITMGSLRRLLEEDLKLEMHSLDTNPFKKFIDKELNEVLKIPDSPKHAADLKKKVKSTPSKKLDSEENSDSDAEDDEEVAVKKDYFPMRKRETAKLVSPLKKAKHAVVNLDNDGDAGGNESMGDNGHSQSSSKKPLKQTKEIATAVYGKCVDHLKFCGMSIPPAIYKKAKQVPEDKREATLIKELKQILAEEGLSSDPSEKEIKEVKKRKNMTKEIEGIDASNIVSSSRRRSITSFAPPPKPKITEASESDESDNGKVNKEEEGRQRVAE